VKVKPADIRFGNAGIPGVGPGLRFSIWHVMHCKHLQKSFRRCATTVALRERVGVREVFEHKPRPHGAVPGLQACAPLRSQDPLTPTLSRRERERAAGFYFIAFPPSLVSPTLQSFRN